MNEYCKKLQQLQIVVAYWTDQAIFYKYAHDEIEIRGTAIEERQAFIPRIMENQKDYIELFYSGHAYQDNLKVICEILNAELMKLVEEACNADFDKYRDLHEEVAASIERLRVLVQFK